METVPQDVRIKPLLYNWSALTNDTQTRDGRLRWSSKHHLINRLKVKACDRLLSQSPAWFHLFVFFLVSCSTSHSLDLFQTLHRLVRVPEMVSSVNDSREREVLVLISVTALTKLPISHSAIDLLQWSVCAALYVLVPRLWLIDAAADTQWSYSDWTWSSDQDWRVDIRQNHIRNVLILESSGPKRL